MMLKGQVPFYLIIFSGSEKNQMEFWVTWNTLNLEVENFNIPNIPNPEFSNCNSVYKRFSVCILGIHSFILLPKA